MLVCVGRNSVWCLLSTHHPCCGVHLSGVCVVMTVCDDSARLVLSHCVVGCGMAVCEGCVSSLVFFFFLLLVFGVVRAQPCEHARYPRTPLCFLVVFSSLCSSLFFMPRLSFCWNGGGGLPCVGVSSWHDCDG